MRKFLIILLFIVFITGPLFSEENQDLPLLTLNVLLSASPAFMGLGAELLLGNIGIGGTFSTFFIGIEDTLFFVYEPGVYLHLYLGNPASALYILGDVTLLGFGVSSSGVTETTEDTMVVKINAGVGFNGYFGDKDNIHFSIELGARYRYLLVDGEYPMELLFPILPHFKLQFGMGVF